MFSKALVESVVELTIRIFVLFSYSSSGIIRIIGCAFVEREWSRDTLSKFFLDRLSLFFPLSSDCQIRARSSYSMYWERTTMTALGCQSSSFQWSIPINLPESPITRFKPKTNDVNVTFLDKHAIYALASLGWQAQETT